jgi:hypothetical protein
MNVHRTRKQHDDRSVRLAMHSARNASRPLRQRIGGNLVSNLGWVSNADQNRKIMSHIVNRVANLRLHAVSQVDDSIQIRKSPNVLLEADPRPVGSLSVLKMVRVFLPKS